MAGVKEMLNSHPDVDQKLPHGAGLSGYTDYAIEVGMLVRVCPMQSLRLTSELDLCGGCDHAETARAADTES